MKKIFFLFLVMSFSFFSIVNSQEREAKLNELFNQLKNNKLRTKMTKIFFINYFVWYNFLTLVFLY